MTDTGDTERRVPRGYEFDQTQAALKVAIDRVMADIALRRYCIEQAIIAGSTSGDVTSVAEDIFAFLAVPAVKLVAGLSTAQGKKQEDA